jgi:hypothetical protein
MNNSDAILNIPEGMSVRQFLRWWLEKADPNSPEYWDTLFTEAYYLGAGDMPITRRKLFRDFLEAHDMGDTGRMNQILQEFEDGEDELQRQILPVFQRQIERMAPQDELITVELGGGTGRNTFPIVPKVINRGGFHFYIDSSKKAVEITRGKLVRAGILTEETAKDCILLGDARNFRNMLKGKVGPRGRVIVLLIRISLHFTMEEERTRFMRDVAEFVLHHNNGMVLHAETSADYIPSLAARQLPGTVFRTGKQILKEFGGLLKQEGEGILCEHHGDKIVVRDFVPA